MLLTSCVSCCEHAETCLFSSTQALPATSHKSLKFDKTKPTKSTKRHILDPCSRIFTEFTAAFPTTDVIVPVMMTKYLFLLAWNRAFCFARPSLLCFCQKVHLYAREMCSKRSAATLRWPFSFLFSGEYAFILKAASCDIVPIQK